MCKLTNNKQLTDNRQHRIDSHEEQPLLFSLVHLILCSRDNKTANAPGRRRCVAHMWLFAIGVLAQATAGVLAILVTRWSFRSLPVYAYTWIPAVVGLGSLVVLVGIGYALSRRSLPLFLVIAAWFVGRLAGVIASAIVPGVGIDAGLLASVSFGLLVLDTGRLTLGLPSAALLLQLGVLALASALGRRSRLSHAATAKSR